MSQKKLRSNIWKFYLHEIFGGLFFILPIAVLFWQDNGLSLTQVMILQSLFSIVVVLLEVPTGYFADIYGRKKTLVIASVGMFLGIVTYSLSHSFVAFLIAESLWAVGNSFFSGAGEALVYDTLVDMKQQHTYKRVLGKAMFYSLMAVAVSSVIGGYVGNINLRWPFFMMIPTMAMLIPITLSFTEPHRHKRIFKKGYLFELIEILKKSFKHKKLRWLVVYGAVIFSLNTAGLWIYQPYFVLSGLNIAYFGIVFALFSVVAGIASKYAHSFEEKVGSRYTLILLVILVGAGYLLLSNFILLFSFTFVFLHQVVRGIFFPIISDHVNKLTTSDIRATVLSAQSMVGRMFYAVVIPVIGYIADVYTVVQALSVLGITTFVIGGVTLFALWKNKVI